MNYYEVLRIPTNATLIEIKKAYKVLVKRYHPDVFDGNKSFAEAKIKEINEAYEVLHNVEKKKEYDNLRKSTMYEAQMESQINRRGYSDYSAYNNIRSSYTQTKYSNVNSRKEEQSKNTFKILNSIEKSISKIVNKIFGTAFDWVENKSTENFMIVGLAGMIIVLLIMIFMKL